MLRNNEFAYAVMTKDLDAYSFEDESFEKCKRYCRGTDVIVEQIPHVCGIQLRIRFYKPWKWIRFDRLANQFNIGYLHVQWLKEYMHKNGKVVYKSEEE